MRLQGAGPANSVGRQAGLGGGHAARVRRGRGVMDEAVTCPHLKDPRKGTEGLSKSQQLRSESRHSHVGVGVGGFMGWGWDAIINRTPLSYPGSQQTEIA